MRYLILVLALLLVMPVVAQAKKTTYVFTDRKFNAVKLEELKKKELKKLGELNHPFEIDPSVLRKNLAGIRVSRKILLSEKVTESEVFNAEALDRMLPHILRAFREATPKEGVTVSFLREEKKSLIRDDRLTIVDAWISGEKLHLKFHKLMAKIPNNYDRIGDVHQAINRAQGLRVSLDLQPGQEYGAGTDELVMPLK